MLKKIPCGYFFAHAFVSLTADLIRFDLICTVITLQKSLRIEDTHQILSLIVDKVF